MSTPKEKVRDDNDDDERGGKRQKVAVDEDEWARFQAEVLDSAALLPQKNFTQNASTMIEAEPVLHNDKEEVQQPQTVEEEGKDDKEGPRQKAEREAREEILSRLDEEQQAQEEADQRVQALKDRLQRIREKRKAGKAKPK
ncbi:hypothetical protein L7F22_042140 [Adiantum nelumboides]|nr:hypothetical protein [Adiantum nelumboides]